MGALHLISYERATFYSVMYLWEVFMQQQYFTIMLFLSRELQVIIVGAYLEDAKILNSAPVLITDRQHADPGSNRKQLWLSRSSFMRTAHESAFVHPFILHLHTVRVTHRLVILLCFTRIEYDFYMSYILFV